MISIIQRFWLLHNHQEQYKQEYNVQNNLNIESFISDSLLIIMIIASVNDIHDDVHHHEFIRWMLYQQWSLFTLLGASRIIQIDISTKSCDCDWIYFFILIELNSLQVVSSRKADYQNAVINIFLLHRLCIKSKQWYVIRLCYQISNDSIRVPFLDILSIYLLDRFYFYKFFIIYIKID